MSQRTRARWHASHARPPPIAEVQGGNPGGDRAHACEDPPPPDADLTARAQRVAWHVPEHAAAVAAVRAILTDPRARRREKISALKVLLQCERLELEALKVTAAMQDQEELVDELAALEQRLEQATPKKAPKAR